MEGYRGQIVRPEKQHDILERIFNAENSLVMKGLANGNDNLGSGRPMHLSTVESQVTLTNADGSAVTIPPRFDINTRGTYDAVAERAAMPEDIERQPPDIRFAAVEPPAEALASEGDKMSEDEKMKAKVMEVLNAKGPIDRCVCGSGFSVCVCGYSATLDQQRLNRLMSSSTQH